MIIGIWIILFNFSSSFASETYSYCIPVAKFDLSPFREITDGKELAYLPTLFLSFISGDKSDAGVLSNYDFSPDGKTFRGRINKNIFWSDKSKVTSTDFVNVFLRTLPHRALGKRVWIKGTKDKAIHNLQLKDVAGVKILNEEEFELVFETDIANLTGVLRDAITTGSRHNRFWMSKKSNDGRELFVARYPIIDVSKNMVSVQLNTGRVNLVNDKRCEGADMGIYPEAMKVDPNNYNHVESPIKQAITVVFNTRKNNLDQRIKMAGLVKTAFNTNSAPIEIKTVESFFSKGEPGYYSDPAWKNIPKLIYKKDSFSILYGIPVLRDLLLKQCANCKFLQIDDPGSGSADMQIFSSAIFGGRHIILQDMLEWNEVDSFLSQAPKTKGTLKRIAEISASTIPPDNQILIEFERSARAEVAVMPVARRSVLAYSKKGLPVHLDWNSGGELIFLRNSNNSKGVSH